MDTIYASKKAGKSFGDYTCVQVYAAVNEGLRADLMKREKDLHMSLKLLFKVVGVPAVMTADKAKAQVQQ